ncbi:hypothetical protein SXCC_02216 [Gluconacetobacter sp. SXCC-1]|nr:hypothetical protein SXCC_02216 [Gluconacetobacter sp. SXCC-1]
MAIITSSILYEVFMKHLCSAVHDTNLFLSCHINFIYFLLHDCWSLLHSTRIGSGPDGVRPSW